MTYHEPLRDLLTDSRLLILNFDDIPGTTPNDESIQSYFQTAEMNGINPRLPQYRQAFNTALLRKTNTRYLVSRYAEDRKSMLLGSSISAEGRTFHLGIDIFCENLETIYAPCAGIIRRIDREADDHSFGNFIIIEPDEDIGVFLFFGHLSSQPYVSLGDHVVSGEPFATIGDYEHGENGGWSRHLHLQLLKNIPAESDVPKGYASESDLADSKLLYPDPSSLFPNWNIFTS